MCDLIIKNANVITLDNNCPKADCIIVENGTIVFVGNHADNTHLENSCTNVIDLRGKTVIPGFNDSHLHLVSLGDSLARLNLSGLNADQIVEKVKDYYKPIKPGKLLMGYDWDAHHCKNANREILDKHFPDNPVVLFQFSGHAVWVNTIMLKKLGYTKRIPPKLKNYICTDNNGNLTGIIYDMAMGSLLGTGFLKMNMLPSTRNKNVRTALSKLAQAGVTSTQDNTWFPTVAGYYRRLNRKNELTCRVSCWSIGLFPLLSKWMDLINFNDEWVTKGPIKYFADGAFSTKTAWLSEPYADSPTVNGLASMTYEQVKSVLRSAAKHNRQVSFHAIGDRAVTEIVNAFEEVQSEYDSDRSLQSFKSLQPSKHLQSFKSLKRLQSLRIRIEHAQLIQQSDLERIRKLGIVLALQPSALISPEKDIALLGMERAMRAYPYQDLLDAGIPVAFGSDVPGEIDYEPLKLIHMAVNRSLGKQISVRDAIYAYTMGSAYAENMEHRKGSITVGKLADLTVLSDDILSIQKETIQDLKVLMTITGGKVVYDDFTNRVIR